MTTPAVRYEVRDDETERYSYTEAVLPRIPPHLELALKEEELGLRQATVGN